MALYFLCFMVISYQLSAPPHHHHPHPHPHPHPHSPSSSCICVTEGQPKQDQNGRLFRTKDPSGTCVEEGSAAAQVSIECFRRYISDSYWNETQPEQQPLQSIAPQVRLIHWGPTLASLPQHTVVVSVTSHMDLEYQYQCIFILPQHTVVVSVTSHMDLEYQYQCIFIL